MKTNATSFKNNLGQYLEISVKEPVIVEKSGRPSAVLISFEEFERLSEFEDLYWSKLADEASKEGYLGVEQTSKRLKELAKKAGIKLEDES